MHHIPMLLQNEDNYLMDGLGRPLRCVSRCGFGSEIIQHDFCNFFRKEDLKNP